MTGIGYIPVNYEYVSSVTIFSFYEQKKRIMYQSSLEIPYQLELVVYNFSSSLDPLIPTEWLGHNEDWPNYNLTWQNVLQYVCNLVAAQL